VFPWANVAVLEVDVLPFGTLTVGVPVSVNPVAVETCHKVKLPALTFPVIAMEPPLNAIERVFELVLLKLNAERTKPPRFKAPFVNVVRLPVVRAFDRVHPPPTPSKTTVLNVFPFALMVLPVVVAANVNVPVNDRVNNVAGSARLP